MSRPTLRPVNGNAPQRDAFDPRIKYIRVRSEPDARFVEFDFAIGDPSLFVELVLPHGAFKKFCEINAVVHMTLEQIAAVDSEMQKWRYGEETLMATNHART
ncbi:Phenol hydroxylase, assembly protein DmpK [Marinobacterium lacunae]|uniref:Phenol hydroxylase, assembly protein DmpK n=1 Tax=Marinobacterium lacunae TaxID=1232683 RepID=A0A081G3K3_9GAMM|nr:phenol hydroxylase subunit [Marinobacterium lacunae]KEA65358.1 Phenol hydroxylase, assembly protein DmpK [Marinobacterium lacunae]